MAWWGKNINQSPTLGSEANSISSQLCGYGDKLLISISSVAHVLIKLPERKKKTVPLHSKVFCVLFLRYRWGTQQGFPHAKPYLQAFVIVGPSPVLHSVTRVNTRKTDSPNLQMMQKQGELMCWMTDTKFRISWWPSVIGQKLQDKIWEG